MMAKLVVDSGIAVKWFVPEPDSIHAELIYQDYQNGSFDFHAPDLIHAEFGNIIWKKRIFQSLSEPSGNAAISSFQNINFNLTATTLLFDDAFRIAIQHQRTFYDSLYLALAARENCDFVTADEKLYNAVKTAFPSVILLANWK